MSGRIRGGSESRMNHFRFTKPRVFSYLVGLWYTVSRHRYWVFTLKLTLSAKYSKNQEFYSWFYNGITKLYSYDSTNNSLKPSSKNLYVDKKSKHRIQNWYLLSDFTATWPTGVWLIDVTWLIEVTWLGLMDVTCPTTVVGGGLCDGVSGIFVIFYGSRQTLKT